jgi:hypothetical protein
LVLKKKAYLAQALAFNILASKKMWLKLSNSMKCCRLTMRTLFRKALSFAFGLLAATVPAYAGGSPGSNKAIYLDSLKEWHGTGDMPVLSFPSKLPNPLIFYTFPSGQIKTLGFPGGVFIRIVYAGKLGIKFTVVRPNLQGKWDWTSYEKLPDGIQYVIKKEIPPTTSQ